MPKKLIIAISVILVIFVAIFLTAGYFLGNVPLASSIMGTNKQKDLGVEITTDAAYSGLEKLNYPTTASELLTIRDNPQLYTTALTSLNSDEASSLLSTGEIENFPFHHIQMSFGPNGSIQTSGVIFTEDIQEYLGNIGIGGDLIDQVLGYVKNISAINYYAEGYCSVTNNQVSLEIEKLQLGKITIPNDLLTNNMGSIENGISNTLTSNGFYVRNLSISEDKVDLDLDRPLASIVPWLDYIQYD